MDQQAGLKIRKGKGRGRVVHHKERSLWWMRETQTQGQDPPRTVLDERHVRNNEARIFALFMSLAKTPDKCAQQ